MLDVAPVPQIEMDPRCPLPPRYIPRGALIQIAIRLIEALDTDPLRDIFSRCITSNAFRGE